MRGVPTLQDLTIGALEQATLLHPACDMRQKGSRGVIIFDRDWQGVWDMARDFPNQSSPFPQSKLRERWAPAPDEWADSHRPGKGEARYFTHHPAETWGRGASTVRKNSRWTSSLSLSYRWEPHKVPVLPTKLHLEKTGISLILVIILFMWFVPCICNCIMNFLSKQLETFKLQWFKLLQLPQPPPTVTWGL